MHFESLIKRKQQLQQKQAELQHKLDRMPHGNLYCVKNGKYYRWDLYHSKNRKEVIPKKNLAFAEKMALKSYYTSQLKDIEKELKAIGSYLKDYEVGKNVDVLLRNPEVYRLLQPNLQPVDEDLAVWINTPYETNPYHREHLVHEVRPGVFVRSKSEALIYSILQKNNIPFHYEEKLQLGNRVIYPDFVIRHPCNGMPYYWEHFGLWDDPSYCKSACSKIQLYALNGIIPTVQLITTYETSEHPLTIAKIERIVEEYFL